MARMMGASLGLEWVSPVLIVFIALIVSIVLTVQIVFAVRIVSTVRIVIDAATVAAAVAVGESDVAGVAAEAVNSLFQLDPRKANLAKPLITRAFLRLHIST